VPAIYSSCPSRRGSGSCMSAISTTDAKGATKRGASCYGNGVKTVIEYERRLRVLLQPVCLNNGKVGGTDIGNISIADPAGSETYTHDPVKVTSTMVIDTAKRQTVCLPENNRF